MAFMLTDCMLMHVWGIYIYVGLVISLVLSIQYSISMLRQDMYIMPYACTLYLHVYKTSGW